MIRFGNCIHTMALNIVCYSSSSESEEEETGVNSEFATNEEEECDYVPEEKRRCYSPGITEKAYPMKSSLPLPDSILTMFKKTTGDDDHQDKPEDHGGRQRSFAHQRGNWASFVYAEVPEDDRVQEMVDSLLRCLRPTVEFTQADDLHVTLSPTVVLKHHWIDPFVTSLRKRLSPCDACKCHISRVKFYTNDEKTRTFLGLTIDVGQDDLEEYVEEIDQSLMEFKLDTYYKDPSFHVSVAWCTGDITEQITQQITDKLQKILADFNSTYPSLTVLNVSQLICKTGNKLHTISLS